MTTYSPTGRYYEDFALNETLVSAGRTITDATLELFSGVTGDYSDVHTDDEVMKASEFKSRIGHGLLSLSIMQGLMWQTGYNRGTASATIGWDKLKFPTPLRVGDTVHADWTISAMRESKSKPGFGILVEDCRLINQRGQPVIAGEHVLLVHKRPRSEG